MTHDELISKLKKQHDYWTNLVHYTKPEFYENTVDQRNGWSALHAVVELHKPSVIPDWVPVDGLMCWCAHMYPCPTIQAIEAELK
jgi:hypothetical protein